jgi:Effector-associated domain 2
MLAVALVGWLVALLGDSTLKGGARVILGTPEQRALTRALDVAITAMMRGLSAESSESLNSALRECFGRGPAVRLDGRTQVRAGLVDAIQQQIGPLAEPISPVGTSFFAEIGVDPDQMRDGLAEVVIRSIEQVGAGTPALTPLVSQLNADAILDKVDQVLNRLEPPRAGAGETATGGISEEPRLSPEELSRLVRAMLEVPAIQDDSARQEILNGLPGPIPNAVPRAARPTVQVLTMVRTCLNYTGGLRALVDGIRLIEGDSVAMRKLDEAIAGLAGPGAGPGSGAPNGQAANG